MISSEHSMVTLNRACEREDCSFMLVAPVCRFCIPNFMILNMWSALETVTFDRSLTKMPRSGLSLISRLCFWSLASRSRISSL